jgi:hypothetical protein
MRAFTLIAGVVCLFAVLLDAFQTIILPRRATGRFRLTRIFYVITLLSGYKSNRINWLSISSKSVSETGGRSASKMGVFSN